MRISASAAAVALGGSLVLGALAAPLAQADEATPCSTTTFGVAGQYGEFVLGDDTHHPDAEGAVAVGGNADFSGGFSVGSELTEAEVAALPGQNSLVVRGDLVNGGSNTVVMLGNAVLGGSVDHLATVTAHHGTVTKGASPIDFTAEFARLDRISGNLAALPANGTASAAGSVLTLTGGSAAQNVMTLDAALLESATEVQIRVPKGATTIVNVTGGSYDMAAANTSSFSIWDGSHYVLDDKSQSAYGGAVRAGLLWNFPSATTVTKASNAAWPGTVLAPKAHVELGTGAPVNGSVLAASLHGSGGAETHHYPFKGCLPVPATPNHGTTPSPSTPGRGSTGTTGGTGGTGGGATPASPSTPATTPASTGGSATGGSTGGGGGSLATTGSNGTGAVVLGGVALLAVGGGIVVATRRRRSRTAG